jgi:ribosomal protein S18 acetylase RimI-like enzyme
MKIRDATAADVPELDRLWRAFENELPESPWVDVDIEQQLRGLADAVAHEVAVVAEDIDGTVAGFALALRAGRRLGRISHLYVAPAARGRGLATRIARCVVERLRELGVDTVRLEVLAGNARARAIYARWGFYEEELTLVTSLDALAQRLTDDK